MSRIMVARKFVWSHYPGMRAGRLATGKSDLTKHPKSETHFVDGPDSAETVCGLPRSEFPNEFAEDVALSKGAEPCDTCLPAGSFVVREYSIWS